ncbi:MAG: EamA family transporter [Albidovulum sp.]|nr:EamA family transporter [Albidovulum sp.]MDE0534096.1 EamA family transporter [Albidovulum sp.]
MISILLLATVTILYAGYNLFIKVSGETVPPGVSSTILATVALQISALATSAVFASILLLRGGAVLQLPAPTYLWAVVAGICIGGAEIAYFYLFGGIGSHASMEASRAIPVVVSGTIVITLVVSYFLFREAISIVQLFGTCLIVAGLAVLFLGNSSTAN